MIRPSSIESSARAALMIAGDFLIALGALTAAVYFRRSVPLSFTQSLLPVAKLRLDALNIALFCGSFIVALAVSGFYRRLVMPTEKPLLATALVIQIALIAIADVAVVRAPPRTIIIAVVAIEAIALPAWRRVLRIALPIRPRQTILIGDAAQVRHALDGVAAGSKQNIDVIGWAGPRDQVADVPWLGEPEDASVRDQIREAEEVIYASPDASSRSRLDLLRVRGERGYLLLGSSADALISSSPIGWIGDQPLIEVAVGCGYGVRAALKRFLDIILGSILFVASLPLMAIAAAAIWLEDRGPSVMRQLRVGRHGVPFLMWKFRSMHTPVVGALDGAAITRVGLVLRRYRVDELPQLINVLSGEMSLVGPRPERPDLAAAIARDLPEFELRNLVKPGMAGLAQVSARYDTRSEVKLRYDLNYMCGWSLMLDLRLLVASVAASLSGSGR